MEIILNIGNSVKLNNGLLGIITHQLGKESNDSTEEVWFEVRDENGGLDHYPLSKLQVDLFEHYETLPTDIRAVYDRYGSFMSRNQTYDLCARFLRECEKLGYTFDYYLDAQPYNLRKINLEVSK